ncbi:MAG: DUF4177 domain-containing protein [SAR202 cluster bacterium]|nr:DUF4177 domain-containing protein [SAR202 cluster bacterium]
MKIFFCPECGGYSLGPASHCDECQSPLPEDSWAEVSEEELTQLEYIDDFERPPGLPSFEYDVIRLKSSADGDAVRYSNHVLNRMGESGWELVNIVAASGEKAPNFAVFKRSWIPDYEE